jgi:hypothetical protein
MAMFYLLKATQVQFRNNFLESSKPGVVAAGALVCPKNI